MPQSMVRVRPGFQLHASGRIHRTPCGRPRPSGHRLLGRRGDAHRLWVLANRPTPGARHRGLQLSVQAASDWKDNLQTSAVRAANRLQALIARFVSTWQEQRWLKSWFSRVLLGVALFLGATTALGNLWGVRALNHQALPTACSVAARVLEREVVIGRVNWVATPGLLGLSPLASVGPVAVGPSATERSSAVLPHVLISIDPVKSLAQRRVVLRLHAPQAQVTLVQNNNFSWFGYPDDTQPTARNVVPGLAQGRPHDERDEAAGSQPDPYSGPKERVGAYGGYRNGFERQAARRRTMRSQLRSHMPDVDAVVPANSLRWQRAGRPSHPDSQSYPPGVGMHAEASAPNDTHAAVNAVSHHTEPPEPSSSLPEALPDPAAMGRYSDKQPGSVSGNRQKVHRSESNFLQSRHGDMGGPAYRPASTAGVHRSRPSSAAASSTVRSWLGGQWARLTAHLTVPQLAVDRIIVRNGTLDALFCAEQEPRHFDQIDLALDLGRDYHDLALKISVRAYERDAASARCTMPGSGNRHLRPQPSAPIVTSLTSAPTVATSNSAHVAAWQRAVGPGGAAPVWRAGPASLPTGGCLDVHVTARGMGYPGRQADTRIAIQARDLHAPLVERILEIPMDIYDGRLDGRLELHCHDAATWHFPSFSGRVVCRDGSFHFWDATDDFTSTSLDLVFDGARVHLHRAEGRFGAVPLSITGEFGMDPAIGQYRLSANVAPVEVNELRRTLGIRPAPMPVAGAVRGVLHCTGPLEQPVFSGTAVTVRSSPDDVGPGDKTAAQDVLDGQAGALAAYDRLPLASASAVFTLDTSTDIFLLHSFQVEPLDGGRLVGSGRMWVAKEAEMDPQAVRIQAQGHSLPTHRLLQRYLPKGTNLPASVVLGDSEIQATMIGSHLAPDIRTRWKAPTAQAHGTTHMTRDSTHFTCKAPALDLTGSLHLRPATFEQIKQAVTQEEATALAVPVLDGCDIDAEFKGLDVLPLVAPAASLERMAAAQPPRLKLNGRTHLSGVVRQAQADTSTSFKGDLNLEGLRVNQLKLSRNLSGSLELAEDGLHIHAKGLRPDEVLDVDLLLPLSAEAQARAGGALQPTSGSWQETGGGHFALRCGQLNLQAQVNGSSSQIQVGVAGLALDELELASLRGEVQEASLALNFEERSGRGQVQVAGPRFSGLQGQHLAASFRWEQDIVRLEKSILQQRNSRYEVAGEYVIPANTLLPRTAASMALRPPAGAQVPGSPPLAPALPAALLEPKGRWRIQVAVPFADMEEILPAARLLSRATSMTAVDYERAKNLFLSGVKNAGMAATDLSRQLDAAAQQIRADLGSEAVPEVAASSGASLTSRAAGGGGLGPRGLPGLQDLRGEWNGSFEAYGGGIGASNVDFNLKGSNWVWGEYALDQMVARGAAHSLDGIKLDEFCLKAGDAKLLVRGSLLSASQNATVLLTDFPVALLQPLLRAMPALEHAAPAITSLPGAPAGGAGGAGPFSGLSVPFVNTAKLRPGSTAGGAAGLAGAGGPGQRGSPVNGLLYIRGTLGGSAQAPQGEVVVRLYEGAIGPTRLAGAQARAALDSAQRLTFSMDLTPAEHRQTGYLRVNGMLPLATPIQGASTQAAGENLDVHVGVKDAGMVLLSTVLPDLRWQHGTADISLRVHGALARPTVEGNAQINRAGIFCPMLKYPMTNVGATVSIRNDVLKVEWLEARVGRRGHIRVKGSLPLRPPPSQMADSRSADAIASGMSLEVAGLEMRMRNLYTGHIDASLHVSRSLLQPVVGGGMRLSRGVAYLSAPPASTQPLPAERSASRDTDIVTKAFTALTSRNDALARQLTHLDMLQQVDTLALQPGVADQLSLQGLKLHLGPELRVVYPVVMNFGISGDIEVNGPATPGRMRVAGTIHLDGGEVNLVATQMVLDREHPNRLTFSPDSGLDPSLDLSFRGAQVRALIQGRASDWQKHLVLSPTKGSGGEGAEALDPSEAAKLFEGQLANALVAEDGQLALSNLAASAAHGLMPKLQTQGQLGQARWRLVSAPSIPGLLSLDPSGDPTTLLSSLTLGTEMEVQFGKSLQAAMARKLRDSDVATQWTLNYQLNNKLRMQFNIASSPPYPRTLIFQFSGEGVQR
ncbi:hypothetical protein WJX72_004315 [[Myrmecia] bisecta]|uniref:Translocation and assembly module TamB C-terminal domain-containing protein n=1 Tax=[Myrmecia] bisecta TaxID=41462 RepID=A0AAW1P735_9CHLO